MNNKKDYKGILEKMGITVTILPDGTVELSHYTSDIDRIALNDFGINENELLANVSRIKVNTNFKDSNATTLPNLSEVGGILDFDYANISNIKNLKSPMSIGPNLPCCFGLFFQHLHAVLDTCSLCLAFA